MLTNKGKPITITFDNGPHPELTPMVLDILARRGIPATFFVVGTQLAKCRAPAERAFQEGHWIGNHTWSHSVPFRDRGDRAFVAEEIDRTQDALGPLAHPDRLFRPYGRRGRLDGALNGIAVDHLAQGAYTCVLWNSVPADFDDATGWPDTAYRQFEELDWPLVVLHDVFGDALKLLDGFLGSLQDRGYEFRQNFPPTTVAMRNGVPTKVMDGGVLAN